MPALSLFGTQYHMASDMMPILGLFLFLPSFGLLVTFTVLISILHSSPQPVCPTGERIIRESVIWGFLSLVALNSVAAAAMIVVGLQGTPFELSKRRAMQPLLYAQSVKWVASLGFTIYCFWAVYDIRHSCWSPALLRLLKGSLWAALAIYTLLFVVFFTGLNLLASYDPDKRWQIRLKKLSRVLGCQSTLTQVVDSENEAETPLQELAGWFGRFFGHIDLEKSDVVVGLALAQIMQVQQRKALIAQRLRQHGVVDPSVPDSSGPAAASTNGGVVATTAEQKPGAAGAAGGAAADSSAGSSQDDPESQVDSEFQRWLLGVAEGSRECLTPSHWGAKFAPELTPKQAAEVYTGCRDYVSLAALVEVQRVAKYAIAAYCVPRRGKPLRSLKKVLAGAKEPVRQQLQGGKARAKQYAAIQQITGCSDDDLIHMSFQNSTLGLCPYQILLNRPSKTVILAVRGSNSMEDLLTDMIDRPVDITAWLPSALREAHPECAQGVSAHMGMYCAAKAVLQDLSKRQILPILLTGAPLDSEQREREHQRHAPDDQQQRYKQERQGGRHSLDTNLGRWQGQRRQVQLQRARWSRQPSGRDSARAFNRWASPAGGSEAGEEVFQTAQSMPAIISMARGQPSFTRNSSWLRESAGQRAADQAAAKSGAAAAAGHAGNESGSSKSGKSTAAAAGEVQLEPADYQRVLAERGVDCRGWKLVVTGHSLGAAVAALVGMQLRDWYPGVHVYAFSPPGGMITANLADVLVSCVTSVVVGKDSISRIGTVTFEGLIDSMVVALARTKLCKVRALLGLRSQALRERPMADLFHTTDAIPAEALAMLKGYWESKRQYADAFVPMCPPGRVLLLRRLKEDDEAYRQRDKQREKQQRCGSGSSTGGGDGGRHWGRRRPPTVAPPKLPLRCCSGCSGGTLLMWDAVWLQPERLVAEGILLGSTQASDHFTSTLSFVLDQLTGHETLRHQPPPDGPDTATATATAAAVATAAVTGVGEPTVAPAPQAEP